MTREEAIEYLSERVSIGKTCEQSCMVGFGVNIDTLDVAFNMAISALRQQDITNKDTNRNEPLTLNELWKIYEASEPVYLYIFRSDIDSGWEIIEQITDRKIIFRGRMGVYVPIKELGVSYNFYRQKPKEERLWANR